MYIYNDEDNAPMEDPWMKYTVYSSKAEADYYENGGHEAEIEAKEAAYQEKKKGWMDGLLDILKLEGGCRECPWINETAEGFMDDNGQITGNQLDYLRHMCLGCKGKGTGKINIEHDDRLAKEWQEFKEWVKDFGLNHWFCPWCKNVYEVYGQYKDPDDEWKAIEDLCGNCRHFGED